LIFRKQIKIKIYSLPYKFIINNFNDIITFYSYKNIVVFISIKSISIGVIKHKIVLSLYTMLKKTGLSQLPLTEKLMQLWL